MSQAKAIFSTEHDLNTSEQQAFWQSVVQDTLIAADGITLAYMMVEHPQAHATIVISSGRVESYLKYQELVFDLYQQGYSVYAIDHRGQGLSDRMTSNPHMGHVQKFTDYVDDFALFIHTKVLPQNNKPLLLLGHSMGGAIGTLYLRQYPKIFTAAAFSAPMYGIKLPMPKKIVRWLASKLDTTLNGGEPNYVLGGQNYKPVSFNNNELTHCQSRYQAYRELYDAVPKLQLGSPTNRWLIEALNAADACVIATAQMDTPILVLQASEDRIVDNAAQNLAVSAHCQLKVITGAAHEIFIEKDAYRNQALNNVLDFFTHYAAEGKN
ncbi:alpha/beta fold hydrolase [Shewanella glacialipiscicola]|uniref:alpha/beta fold hydrolase n=1 Tax=Shewanella glacialipiscicola TaxID=614069 RepID=UPI003D7A8611